MANTKQINVDFNEKITLPNGEVGQLTLGEIAAQVLNVPRGERNEQLTNGEIFKRGELALNIAEANEPVEVSQDDLHLIKSLLYNCNYGTIVATLAKRRIEEILKNV